MFGFIFLLLQYLKELLGYSPSRAGVGLVPMAIVAMVGSPAAGTPIWHPLGRRSGNGDDRDRSRHIGGLHRRSGLLAVLARTALLGAGIVFAATPATDAIVAALPSANLGVASALYDLTRELGGGGGVLGVVVLGSVFNNVHRIEIGKATRDLPGDAADGVRDSFAGALHLAEH